MFSDMYFLINYKPTKKQIHNSFYVCNKEKIKHTYNTLRSLNEIDINYIATFTPLKLTIERVYN